MNRTEYTLLDITDEGFVSLMLADGTTKEDLRLPDGDLGDNIRAAFDDGKEVSLFQACSLFLPLMDMMTGSVLRHLCHGHRADLDFQGGTELERCESLIVSISFVFCLCSTPNLDYSLSFALLQEGKESTFPWFRPFCPHILFLSTIGILVRTPGGYSVN